MKHKIQHHLPVAAVAAGCNPLGTVTSPRRTAPRVRHASSAWLAALLVGFAAVIWQPGLGLAQQAAEDADGAQVLTRGPVHEAFAGIVTFNPEPGVVVSKAPPAVIEEIPPAERPEGTNVAWIPGYWAWDDERSDFLWVSGIWRALPPGRQWIAGYWGQTTQGYQWTSGYWADAAAQETTYLPAPPATVETGPNIEAPSRDHGWTPGTWVWQQQRYAWRPGYWAQGRADWDWIPAHYVWTPRGYVFIDGYWDYSVARRGVAFAPVLFESRVYSRAGYSYSPSIVIDLALFAEQLFLRPRYHHYYFGDYYAPSYRQGGFYASYTYQSSRFGYDPIYSHQRWQHRQDRDWERRVEQTYQYRRDNENARPPRTWSALRALEANPAAAKQDRAVMAAPLDQLAKRKDGPLRFQEVPKEDRQKLALRGQEIQKSREQRRTLETRELAAVPATPGTAREPSTVKLPKSPIVAKAPTELKKSEMPPESPRAPKADLKVVPKPATPGAQPGDDQPGTQPEPRKPGKTPREPKAEPQPRKPEKTPREPKAEPQPRKPEVTPREPKAEPQPRKPEVTPREPKKVQPEPRKPEVTPREPKKVQPEPRKPEVTPRESKKVQPEPRKPEVTPGAAERAARDKAAADEKESNKGKKDKKEPK